MRALVNIGVVVIIFGIIALSFGLTSFAGPFHVDVREPVTIALNPIVGIAAVAVGIVMVVVGSRARPSDRPSRRRGR
jgi:hypothetical protein